MYLYISEKSQRRDSVEKQVKSKSKSVAKEFKSGAQSLSYVNVNKVRTRVIMRRLIQWREAGDSSKRIGMRFGNSCLLSCSSSLFSSSSVLGGH